MGLTQKARRRWWWLRDVRVVDCPCVPHVLSWPAGMRAHGRIAFAELNRMPVDTLHFSTIDAAIVEAVAQPGHAHGSYIYSRGRPSCCIQACHAVTRRHACTRPSWLCICSVTLASCRVPRRPPEHHLSHVLVRAVRQFLVFTLEVNRSPQIFAFVAASKRSNMGADLPPLNRANISVPIHCSLLLANPRSKSANLSPWINRPAPFALPCSLNSQQTASAMLSGLLIGTPLAAISFA